MIKLIKKFMRRESDRAPLAQRIKQEHEADLGAISLEASRKFSTKYIRSDSDVK